MPMTARTRDIGLIAATALFLLAGLVLGLRGRGGRTSYDEMLGLVRDRRWEEAQSRLDAYLRAHPNDSRARLLAAKVALDRPRPEPERALEHVRAVRTHDRRTAAVAHVYEGFAFYRQARYDRAIVSWETALQIDPLVPEAGWGLLFVYDVQGRREEAHGLALRLFASEPDPQDRVRLLLEASRQDVETVAPESVVSVFQSIYRENPDDLPNAVALGRALIRDSHAEQGVSILRDAVRRHPCDARAWDGLLSGLDDATWYQELVTAFHRIPPTLADHPSLLKHKGRVAQEAGDDAAAAAAYRRAWEAEPFNKVLLYRLGRALQRVGARHEAAEAQERYRLFESAAQALGPVYRTAKETRTLGIQPHRELYQRLALLRQQMGRFDEARAWHLLVLRDDPTDPVSLAAVEQLGLNGTGERAHGASRGPLQRDPRP